MNQTILIESDETLKDLLSLNLSNYLGTDVIPHGSAEDAIGILNLIPSISLVIARDNIGSEPTAEIVSSYLKEQGKEAKLIVLGQGAPANEMVVADPTDWKAIVKASAKALGLSPEALKARSVPDYAPIPLRYFLSLKVAPCDIFIRVKKSDEYQYIKRIHAQDKYERSMIERYAEQGLKEFYIPKEFQQNFVNSVSNQLVQKLEKTRLSLEERVEMTGETFDFAMTQLKELGFTSSTTQMVEAVMDSMMTTVTKVDGKSGLVDLLKKLLANKASYTYRHCHLNSVIASTLIKNSEWGNNEQVKKMIYVAFFHDICLEARDDLSHIASDEALENSNLSEQDKQKVRDHALEAAKLIADYPDAPMGADTIIKQHHGSTTGKGFVQRISANISPLAAVFLISEEFVHQIMSAKGGKIDLKQCFQAISEKYEGAQAQKAIKLLMNSFS